MLLIFDDLAWLPQVYSLPISKNLDIFNQLSTILQIILEFPYHELNESEETISVILAVKATFIEALKDNNQRMIMDQLLNQRNIFKMLSTYIDKCHKMNIRMLVDAAYVFELVTIILKTDHD